MQYSIVNLSEVRRNSDFRIDAEYWEPEFTCINKYINKYNFEKLLNENRIITDGSHEVREYKDAGVLFLRVQDIFENNIEIKEKIFISEEENKKLNRSEPRNNKDILITKTGKIGVATVFTLNEKVNIPADIAMLKNNSNLNSFFISTFINSKYGNLQFIRNQSGLGRPRLVLSSFDNLLIPILSQHFQQSIANLVSNSYSLHQSADNLYQEAENILLEELNLKDYKLQNKKCFTKNLSDTQKAGRFDAEYFQPKYEDIIERIKGYKGGCSNLKEICNITSGSFVSDEFYSKEGMIPYIRIKELNLKGQINKNDIIYLNSNFKLKNETVLKDGDFVIAIIGNTIGKINIVDNDLEGGIPSNNTSKISLKINENNHFFLLLFQSFIFQLQIEREYTQTVQPKISDNQLYNIIFPIISPSIQSTISTKIRQSFTNREKSKQLLEVAKRAIEIAIEENEEKGLDYIKNNSNFTF